MEACPRTVEVYLTPDETSPFDEWMGELEDHKGKAEIETRINKLRRGLLGDYRGVGEGIIELRIDSGPGYRIYCVDDGRNVLILLAGRKRKQRADIARAKEYWREYNS